ncbi:MAG: lysine--tRNA ligase [Syntrophaceae bacterium CG2_30_49_12]|nr:MAG: lysine--tRNA ligase [Syntrophaceae bacterium CG2_30_49_12]PIP05548.1 MAG: lysine--tRNA ligase [Syntrophobacterales bacterium CG23_combo_of_CG06-09_8_20_14_all_48_27]PJA50506.1 MAG: lysine--tRNA ligase [Syntrophobacterales bacterium CG_4_9_14_3_um_filter_49_8]PJC73423.1 MAG: lysine--tRNA ligase [Syntrophobacterales bacterium CG_4_8_14_3_um_filter_49_14]
MEEGELLKKRMEKTASLKADGIGLYANDVRVRDTTASILSRFDGMDHDALARINESFTLAGRLMAVRNFGKAAFVDLQDRKGRIQGYINKNALGDNTFSLLKRLDIGDIIFIAGGIFKTKTGELTIEVDKLRLLSKAIRPLPEKWHGLTDVEVRYRQRYLDLIVNPKVKDVFYKRSRIIQLIRQFMEEREFLEVETPMMQPKAGGAMARPFKTHHNALGMDFYLRIAPELYLKRLITGGLERVYEINRNFRNEGISTFHNPEFTMMEFYQAYATYEDLMIMTEEMFTFIAREIFGSLNFQYQGTEIDLTPPWPRIPVREAIIRHGKIAPDILEDPLKAIACARKLGLPVRDSEPLGKVIMAIFDETVEKKLIQPHFVTHYPVLVSPLARRNTENHDVTDRFELFIYGKEIANAFSELNDPIDQRERFLMQRKEREAGDEEAHEMDEDYIKVLEYGMPPAAGEGVGIDRMVMLFTDCPSIRDVILFPHMRTKEG